MRAGIPPRLRPMSRLSLCVGAALVGVLLGAPAAGGERSAARSSSERAPTVLPLFGPHPSLTMERDMPAVVRARIAREQRRVLRLARSSARDAASRTNGCVPSDFPGSLGPPAPRVIPRVFGYQVEVLVDYARLPRSLQCRPWTLRVYVHSADGKINFDSSFAVEALRGRIVVNLAWFGHPPYRLVVYSEALSGRRGPTVEISLRCPGTGHRVEGCLAGLAGFSPPKPELPLRDVTLSALKASLDYVLGPQRRPPILQAAPSAARCSSLRACEVTYVDRAFPGSPFRVRYRIVGQQVRGCWLGLHGGMVGRRPYEDAGGGPPTLAACTSWVR